MKELKHHKNGLETAHVFSFFENMKRFELKKCSAFNSRGDFWTPKHSSNLEALKRIFWWWKRKSKLLADISICFKRNTSRNYYLALWNCFLLSSKKHLLNRQIWDGCKATINSNNSGWWMFFWCGQLRMVIYTIV